MQTSRRGWRGALALGLGLTLSASLLACAPDGEDPAIPKAPAGPAVITWSVYGSPAIIAAYARIASEFTAKHPEVVVNVRPHDNHDDAMAALAKARSSKKMPDLFQIGHEDLGGLHDDKAIEPVDKLLVEREVDFGDDFPRTGMNAFTADARLQCMPTEVSPLVAYINTERINLPTLLGAPDGTINPLRGWTMEQAAQAAEQASAGGRRGLYVEPSIEQLAPMLLSGGGKLVDDDDKPTSLALADDANKEPLEQILKVVRNPRITFSDEDLKKRSALERFRRGNLGIMFGYRDLTRELRESGMSFAVLPVPKLGSQATVARMSAMCLPKDSPNAEVVGDFLAHLVSTEAMQTLTATGEFVPANLDVVNSDAFVQPNLMPEYAGVFADQIRRVVMLPDAPGWATVYAQANKSLSALFYDPVIEPLEERLTAIDGASVATLKTVAGDPDAEASASPSAE